MQSFILIFSQTNPESSGVFLNKEDKLAILSLLYGAVVMDNETWLLKQAETLTEHLMRSHRRDEGAET